MANFTITENFGTYQGETSYILDKNTSNCWRADKQQGAGMYVLATADKPIQLTSVTYITTQSNEVFSTGAYLQVSLDGNSFTDIAQFNGSTSQTFNVNQKCQYIRIYCKSGNNYVSISELDFDFVDASTKTYTVSLKTAESVVVDKDVETIVEEGTSYSVEIRSAVTSITDNGVDVLESLVKGETGGSVTKYPNAYTTSGTIKGTGYKNCIGKSSTTTATGNDYSNGGSSSKATITYNFDFSDIPANAIIESVEVLVGGHCENASRSTASFQLYSGDTAKGNQGKFSSTSKQVITLTAGTWTRDELQDAKLIFTIGYYGGLINGIDFKVTYKIDGVVYVYTINSVNDNHIILINMKGETSTPLRIKINGSWSKVIKGYKKQNGSWIEIDVSTLNKDITYRYME